MDLNWPQSAQDPCIGPSVEMKGMSENGSSLKIPVAEKEFVWIEYRSNYGFDQHLPGSGILVTYQDRSVGDEEQNELNNKQYCIVAADWLLVGPNWAYVCVSKGEYIIIIA